MSFLAAIVAACADPHAPSVVDRLDCAACHISEYEARVRIHEPQQASTRCYECHGTGGWSPVLANPRRHNRDRDDRPIFGIETVSHAGYSCWQCHVDPDPDDPFNGVPRPAVDFACTSCHEHGRGRTDPRHGGIEDYAFDSAACLRCHPRGEED